MHIFRRVRFTTKRQEFSDEDKSNIENFATSLMCKSFEKKLRDRIHERNENALRYVKEGNVMQSLVFVSQIEELDDILLELENIRKDVEKKNA